MSICPNCGAIGRMRHIETYRFASALEHRFVCGACDRVHVEIQHRAASRD